MKQRWDAAASCCDLGINLGNVGPRGPQGEKGDTGADAGLRIPYTAIMAGDSHTARMYRQLNNATGYTESGTGLLTVTSPNKFRTETGARISSIYSEGTGVIEAPLLSDTDAGCLVRRTGVDIPASGPLAYLSCDKMWDCLNAVYFVQAHVGRPFDELDVLGVGGYTIAQVLRLIQDHKYSKKAGFFFYLAGQNSLSQGITADQCKVECSATFDLIKDMAHVVVVLSNHNPGYPPGKTESMVELNSWMQDQCAARGFLFADVNSAYVIRDGVQLRLDGGDITQMAAEWMRWYESDPHYNPTSAWAVAETVLLPLIGEMLPQRLKWDVANHKKYNFLYKSTTFDPMFSFGTGLPSGCIPYVTNTVPTYSRISLNGKTDSAAAHTAWAVNCTDSNTANDSAFVFSMVIRDLNALSKLAGKEICFACDFMVPSGGRISSFHFIAFESGNPNGKIGSVLGGSQLTRFSNASGIYSDGDVEFSIISPWFVIPKDVSAWTNMILQVIPKWQGDANIAHGKTAKMALANPRILLREDWVGK